MALTGEGAASALTIAEKAISNAPVIDMSSIKGGEGKIGKSGSGKHLALPESGEKERETHNFLQEFGINKTELIFQKWLEKTVDKSSYTTLPIEDPKAIRPIAGCHLTIDQKLMLADYFNMCAMEDESEKSAEGREDWNAIRMHHKANTPFEIASSIFQDTMKQNKAKEEALIKEGLKPQNIKKKHFKRS
jgi:hypothetical protein